MSGPLSGVKVLSFCRALAGPYATQLLSDLGAEVIKLEDPNGGDMTRFGHPRLNDVSTYFLSVNRGKKSITLNLKDDRAKKIVFDLVTKVDILVENYRPGVMKRLGLDYDTVRQHNPKIIYASISGFGQTGPYSHRPAYDMLAQSMGGTVSLTGLPDPDTPPVRVGYSIGDMGASIYGAVAIQAALYEREKTGEGQWVDVSMLDSQVALCENAIVRYCATGEIPRPQGSRHPLSTPFQVFSTKDGAVTLLAARDDHWPRFCRAAGREDWIEDERYGTNVNRLRNYADFEKDMNELMRTKTSKEWEKLFDAHEIMWGPVNNIEDVVNDPHINAREMIIEVDHPQAGRHRVAGTPMKFSRTPCQIEKGAPELGANNEEILSDWLGLSDDEIQELRNEKVI
jgi:CoA:oxalate CoA-transferase